MSNVYCPSCGELHASTENNCAFCGANLAERVITSKNKQVIPQHKTPTFFCPKCNVENSIDNRRCKSCNESFSQYNIRTSFSQTSVSKTAKFRDKFVKRTSTDETMEKKTELNPIGKFILTIGIAFGVTVLVFIIFIIIWYLTTFVWY